MVDAEESRHSLRLPLQDSRMPVFDPASGTDALAPPGPRPAGGGCSWSKALRVAVRDCSGRVTPAGEAFPQCTSGRLWVGEAARHNLGGEAGR